ncbi:MAG: membrane-associated protease RseP (regulator of RpoE activity) [Cognaticolwellia sp.]
MAGLRNLIRGNPIQLALSSTGMRKFRPLLLFLLPMIAVWIWAGLSGEGQPLSTGPQPPTATEILVRRTGVETLAPRQAELEEPAGPLGRPAETSMPSLEVPVATLTRIQGEVLDQDGDLIDAVVFSTKCSSRAYTENGRFDLYFFASSAMECDVQASTQHGMLNAISETEWVNIEPEQQAWVRLHLDSQPQGGLGVAFVMSGDGAEITRVHPNGPGMRGGLKEGDVILEVDGQSFAGVYDQNAFIQTTVGPVGSQVSLLLEGESQIRTFTRGHIGQATPFADEADPAPAPIDAPETEFQDSGWLPDWDTGWLDTGRLESEIDEF